MPTFSLVNMRRQRRKITSWRDKFLHLPRLSTTVMTLDTSAPTVFNGLNCTQY